MTNTSPLPPVDHAQTIAAIQQAFTEQARKLKAIMPNVSSSATANAVGRLSDMARRAALIADTLVIDLHNAARRADLENGAPLPDDPSGSQGSANASISGILTTMVPVASAADTTPTPLFLQDQPAT